MRYKKEKQTYFFNSKYEVFNYPYGISPTMKQANLEKLEAQKNWLKNTYLEIDGGKKYINMLDVAYGANIKPETYHAEIWHRVKTLQDYAKEKGFTVPFLISIHPRSCDKPLKQVQLPTGKIKLVDNKNYNGDLDYVKNARLYISEKWQKFLRQRIFSDMKKRMGERLIYMRTYEPHMDGTPHAHIMCFVPPAYAERFEALAKEYFKETLSDVKSTFNDEKHVIAYVLKYILKSFSNAKNGFLDDVGHWYTFHQIRRFTTSRTLVPLKIFRLLGQHKEFQDLEYVNRIYKGGMISLEVGLNPFKLYDIDYPDLRAKDFYIATVEVFREDGISSCFEVLYEKNLNIRMYEKDPQANPCTIPKDFTKNESPMMNYVKFNPSQGIFLRCKESEKDKQEIIPVYLGNDLAFLKVNGEYVPYTVPFAKMKDYTLWNYYMGLDVEKSPQHYQAVHNELVRRCLLDGEKQPIQTVDQIIEEINEMALLDV